jgi:hypothetical protein
LNNIKFSLPEMMRRGAEGKAKSFIFEFPLLIAAIIFRFSLTAVEMKRKMENYVITQLFAHSIFKYHASSSHGEIINDFDPG